MAAVVVSGEVELEVEGDHLVLRPAARARSGWETAYRRMADSGHDSVRRCLVADALGGRVLGVVAERLDVFLIALDPTLGSEIRKTRPCLVVSPDEMNRHIRTLIVAPMTNAGRAYPTRITCTFKGKRGRIVLDQIRTIDRDRLVRRLGRIDRRTGAKVLATLGEMFSA